MRNNGKPTDNNPFGEEEIPPFPSEPRRHNKRGQATSVEFLIPESEKQAYLDAHYPFEDPPKLDERKFDLHSGKFFYVRDYKLVREEGLNYICSPYYYESGGTIMDWMEPEGFEANDGKADNKPHSK